MAVARKSARSIPEVARLVLGEVRGKKTDHPLTLSIDGAKIYALRKQGTLDFPTAVLLAVLGVAL